MPFQECSFPVHVFLICKHPFCQAAMEAQDDAAAPSEPSVAAPETEGMDH